ncbi:DUF3846 domain-containing protein [Streptomyces zaomyceticus]|uniref:DUF3846 domain-containing protein n=1 Tax=Streptomyces zaomyceticus TaxID=68286 RepID=UPI003693E7C0
MSALLITPKGEITLVELPADTGERLTAMYSLMRCDSVDVVALTNRLDMWLDDEGLFRQPVNRLATLVARRFGWTYQSYHGAVLLTGGANEEGETLPLSEDKTRALLASLTDL